uniref:Ubiquitin-conjugating enzyme E2 Q2 n=1 Tax=Aceria tosichella TaxID=561515 RepID=A0A6G1SJR8_9ACAR
MSEPVNMQMVIVVVIAILQITQVAHANADNKHGTASTSKRLMRELQGFYESGSYKNGIFAIELVNDDIYEWNVKVFKFDPDSKLQKSLLRMKEEGNEDAHVMFHIKFPDNYPFSPPFMRVAHPHIYGGFVLTGGAICMEILSEQHWSSAYTVELLIMQITSVMAQSGDIVPISDDAVPYSYRNAKLKFDALVKYHGWGSKDRESG